MITRPNIMSSRSGNPSRRYGAFKGETFAPSRAAPLPADGGAVVLVDDDGAVVADVGAEVGAQLPLEGHEVALRVAVAPGGRRVVAAPSRIQTRPGTSSSA